MGKPDPGWIDRLPKDQLIAEVSVWSADLINLQADLERITPHADVLHIDVADGVFAPSYLFFPDLVAAIRALSDLPIHVHLMVADDAVMPQMPQFAEAGADLISFHAENASVADAALDLCDRLGVAKGLALRVETPVAQAEPWIERLDFLTLLGTRLGVKGQGLDPSAGTRLQEAAAMIAGTGRSVVLAADGGIREKTVPLLRKSGARTVVLGSLAFGAPDLDARMDWLKAL